LLAAQACKQKLSFYYLNSYYTHMNNHEINQTYGISHSFYEVIKPYIEGEDRRIAETPLELVTIWQAALETYDDHPEQSNAIAEWAMSAVASSPLINEPAYEDIHARFGHAEVPADDEAEQWKTINELVNEVIAENETHSATDL
jgi:hypothetical protein